MMAVRWWSTVALILGLLLAACAPAGPAGPQRITLKMEEYRFDPATITVKAGQEVRLTLVNQGKETHELMIGRELKTENGRPAGFHQNFFEGITVKAERGGKAIDVRELMEEEEEEHGFMVVLEPGSEPVTLIFTVPADKAGEWQMGCFENDGAHWDLGMQGKWIVQP
jgi:plastocyanin